LVAVGGTGVLVGGTLVAVGRGVGVGVAPQAATTAPATVSPPRRIRSRRLILLLIFLSLIVGDTEKIAFLDAHTR
jgi:hypothetical protein